MDSLDAQCLLIQTTEGHIRPPDIWYHHRDGTLSCAYEGGETVFTWPPEDVATMARRWRDSAASPKPRQARLLQDAHRRLQALAREASLSSADVMIHDLGRGELRGIWNDEEALMVVEVSRSPSPMTPA